jgi:hypothetical protein
VEFSAIHENVEMPIFPSVIDNFQKLIFHLELSKLYKKGENGKNEDKKATSPSSRSFPKSQHLLAFGRYLTSATLM